MWTPTSGARDWKTREFLQRASKLVIVNELRAPTPRMNPRELGEQHIVAQLASFPSIASTTTHYDSAHIFLKPVIYLLPSPQTILSS
mmetsp:Transcript_8264/g.17648  ORF Transcript_8264/g.17648 Transcript_8264/m.17648 type:complete len:87 (-) Transcript_8264:981-1241(-)